MSVLANNPTRLGPFQPPSQTDQYGGDILNEVGAVAGGDIVNSTQSLTTAETVLSNIIGLITTLGALFFIFYFLLGAFNWLNSGGDSGKVQKARDMMVQATIGLVVLVASYAVVGLIGTIVGLNILQPGAALETLIPTATTP